MTFAGLLIDTCTIQRNTPGVADGYGLPAPSWADLHTDEACRHVSGKGREVKVGQDVVIVYDELFVGDIDVTEQDRAIIGGTTYSILSVVFRQDGVGSHHKQLFIEVVK
ncbi:MAG: head-tail adaptor protein [Gammaproteobacteria bacterium]|nr:head-tail adaptor protein [Gammaproteobacteria bacterium]MBU2249930.1 head-tail adaptor protein [Gammaproteobacteria bacterium]MBU2685586.1 head-tail adaptor protein [Gammaproteobacteria bacterium]